MITYDPNLYIVVTNITYDMRIALKFAYDGRPFSGYARQPTLRTVEGELLQTLIGHGYVDDAPSSCFQSASRTDKGVSALGNVISFTTSTNYKNILEQLNSTISDIICYGLAEVSDDFYPRYARLRWYRYYLPKQLLSHNMVCSILSLFTGTHDFSNFARVESGRNPVRIIDNIVVNEENDLFIIDFFAQTYLWHQLRRIISAVEYVGKNKITITDIKNAIENPDKKVDFGLAQAEPLLLKDVIYSFDFSIENEYRKKVSELEHFYISKL